MSSFGLMLVIESRCGRAWCEPGFIGGGLIEPAPHSSPELYFDPKNRAAGTFKLLLIIAFCFRGHTGGNL